MTGTADIVSRSQLLADIRHTEPTESHKMTGTTNIMPRFQLLADGRLIELSESHTDLIQSLSNTVQHESASSKCPSLRRG
jgi:hypothetical protein